MNKTIKTITFVFVALVIVLTIFLSGCVPQPRPQANDTGVTAEGVASVINANNQFTFELYSQLKEENKDKNIFFSPYSISTALAMTYEGAKGQTAKEMQNVFHFPEDASIRKPAFAAIYNQINKPNSGYQLNTANALWAQENYSFLDEYFSTVESHYGGKVTNLDFIGETEKSRQTINSWVEQQTNNKIKDLISPGMLNPMTRLVLTNAIYFKGKWVNQFDKKDTKEQDFKVSSEKTVKVPMMYLKEDFNYTETEQFQILEMSYDGNELSMLVILPKDNLSDLDSLNEKNISQLKTALKKEEVVVYMPKFTFETKYSMSETFKKMGMPTAFSGVADFSGMTGKQDLFIDFVIHQAFVDVNEEGTEAAAATGAGMAMIAAPGTVFSADHPFLFIIQEKATGNILFFGQVIDPTVK